MDLDKKQKFENLKNNIENNKIETIHDSDRSYKVEDKKYTKYAMNYLSKRLVSEKQLCNKLRLKFGKDDFTNTIEKMKSLKFLNDDNLTEMQGRYLATKKLYSNRRIRVHLMQKGLSKSIIDKYLESYDDEYQRASILFKKRYKSRDQISRLLSSYGYSFDIIRKCLEDYDIC